MHIISRTLCLFFVTLYTSYPMNAENKNVSVIINTSFGEIEIKLYDETTLHRNNFLKLIEDDFYEDQIFHRVIKDFMIQGGDPLAVTQSKDAYSENLEYTIPPEIISQKYFHKRGALAAARLGDSINPNKESSSTQFYIVTGTTFSDDNLNLMEKHRFEKLKKNIFDELNNKNKNKIKELYRSGEKEKLAELRSSMIVEAENIAEGRKTEVLFTQEQRNIYKTEGGSPHLDGDYTVFGEVVRGMEVIDRIQQVKTDEADKPIHNIEFAIYLLNKN